MAAISAFDRTPTACFAITRVLNCDLPIRIVAGFIYSKRGEKLHDEKELTIVKWPDRVITLNVPNPCDNLMYQLFGYYTENDEGPSARKVGPARDLFQSGELWLFPCDPKAFESEK